MITSEQIITLCEKYLTAGRQRRNFIQVYENPTPADISELDKFAKKKYDEDLEEIRFLGDARPPQKLFIADAHYAIHADIVELLAKSIGGTGWSPDERNYYIGGTAKITKSGKPEVIDMYYLAKADFSKTDWSWILKYLSVGPPHNKILGLK